jgi:hypothetical protein
LSSPIPHNGFKSTGTLGQPQSHLFLCAAGATAPAASSSSDARLPLLSLPQIHLQVASSRCPPPSSFARPPPPTSPTRSPLPPLPLRPEQWLLIPRLKVEGDWPCLNLCVGTMCGHREQRWHGEGMAARVTQAAPRRAVRLGSLSLSLPLSP